MKLFEKNSKTPLIIFIVPLIIIIIVLAANRHSSTTSNINTDAPQSYPVQNQSYKYSISDVATLEYPSNWQPASKLPNNLYTKMFSTDCSGGYLKKQDGSAIIAIEFAKLTEDKAFCWSNGNFSDYTSRAVTTAKPTQNITVAKWKQLQQNEDSPLPQWQGDYFEGNVTFTNDKYAIIISMYVNGNDLKESEAQFDNIIGSFKFNQ